MDQERILEEISGIVAVLADEIYFRKCMFYNVPCLSDSDKKTCIDEAVELLPKFLEYYKKVSEVVEVKRTAESNNHCLCNCDWSEA